MIQNRGSPETMELLVDQDLFFNPSALTYLRVESILNNFMYLREPAPDPNTTLIRRFLVARKI